VAGVGIRAALVDVFLTSEPSVARPRAIAGELVDAIGTIAPVLARFGSALVDIDLAPSTGVAIGTGAGVIVDSIITRCAILTKIIEAIIIVLAFDSISGEARFAFAGVRPIGVDADGVEVADVHPLALVDIFASGSVEGCARSISVVTHEVLTIWTLFGWALAGVARIRVDTSVEGGAGVGTLIALVDINAFLPNHCVPLLAGAGKGSVRVGADCAGVAVVDFRAALVDVVGALRPSVARSSAIAGVDAGSCFLNTYAVVLARVGIAIGVGKRGAGRRRGLGRGRWGFRRALGGIGRCRGFGTGRGRTCRCKMGGTGVDGGKR